MTKAFYFIVLQIAAATPSDVPSAKEKFKNGKFGSSFGIGKVLQFSQTYNGFNGRLNFCPLIDATKLKAVYENYKSFAQLFSIEVMGTVRYKKWKQAWARKLGLGINVGPKKFGFVLFKIFGKLFNAFLIFQIIPNFSVILRFEFYGITIFLNVISFE